MSIQCPSFLVSYLLFVHAKVRAGVLSKSIVLHKSGVIAEEVDPLPGRQFALQNHMEEN